MLYEIVYHKLLVAGRNWCDYALNETLDTVKLQVYPVVAGRRGQHYYSDQQSKDPVRQRTDMRGEQEKNAGEGFLQG